MIETRPETSTPASPGWFGKIASLGDFARRRLPGPVADAFDAWLADAVATSRMRLGDRWQELYLTSPVWRFVLAPGCIDADWWFGVLMPSCDNVGRYFPLVIAQSCRDAPPHDEALANLEAWLANVTDAALDTLRPDASLAGFEESLSRVALSPCGLSRPIRTTQFDDRTRYEVDASEGLKGLLQGLAALPTMIPRGRSLWWPVRPDSSITAFRVTTGLPGGDAFSQMLEGTW